MYNQKEGNLQFMLEYAYAGLICLKFYSKSAQITQYSTAVWMKWNESSQNVKPFNKKKIILRNQS